ncbi:hypothetical protein HJC23_011510 [Cyclotella cryptica]|uniref:3'(2'),5'-bisphosphate nucleotidase n=1 Tax=Cyclotella cryptica TaxID=29204 RepID=A0ABD3PTP4_9STRA|eukprot:CCRYP_011310-RA/>CCRYP_011310-RA protein AED:0.16 eAED:0.16 QI:160/1/1/1/1/1/2/235/557
MRSKESEPDEMPNTAGINTPEINSIPLPVLLSTCIDACRRGCEVIRSVHCRSLIGDSPGSDSRDLSSYQEVHHPSPPSILHCSPNRTIAHTFKPTSHNTYDPLTNTTQIDPRSALTEADEASQAVVMECLRCCWEEEMKVTDGSKTPRLWVVGEEDDNEEGTFSIKRDVSRGGGAFETFERYNVPRPDVVPILTDVVSDMGEEQQHDVVSLEQRRQQQQQSMTGKKNKQYNFIVFIDPLDGTREYIENRIHNVQCLIGITLNGIPIAGAVGLPFGSGSARDDANVIEVAYGWVMPKNDVISDSELRASNIISNSKTRDTSNFWKVLSSGVMHFNATNKMPQQNQHLDQENNGLLSSLGDSDDDDTLIVLSGDSKKPALQMTMDCLEKQILGNESSLVEQHNNTQFHGNNIGQRLNKFCLPYRKIISGGCGNKILYLGRRYQMLTEKKRRSLEMEADHSVLPPTIVGSMSVSPPGSSSWDTAAPTAVLLAMDPHALVTDLVGRPLNYNGTQLTNEFGVVVSSGEGAVSVHRELCCRLANDEHFRRVIGVDVEDLFTIH